MDRMCGVRAERKKLKMLTIILEGRLSELGEVSRDLKRANELLRKFNQFDIADSPVKIVLNRGIIDNEGMSSKLEGFLEHSDKFDEIEEVEVMINMECVKHFANVRGQVLVPFECNTSVVVIGKRCVRISCRGEVDEKWEVQQVKTGRWNREPNGKCQVDGSLVNMRRIRVTMGANNSLVVKLNLAAELLEVITSQGKWVEMVKTLVLEKIFVENPPLLKKAMSLFVGNLNEQENYGRIHVTMGSMTALEATDYQVDLATFIRDGKWIIEN